MFSKLFSRPGPNESDSAVSNGDPQTHTELSDQSFLRLAYELVLGRPIDPLAFGARTEQLSSGSVSREATLVELRQSPEAQELVARTGDSLHYSRKLFVRSLPPARRILDLGGVDLNDERGALVSMAYPYQFDELTIVDLPSDDRHPVYQSNDSRTAVETEFGPVRYEYHSMADLTRYPDDSFDLIYSGQSFEHITQTEGVALLPQIRRVLKAGGRFALDTPNRRATEVELAALGRNFVDPDHKIEYHHDELLSMFNAAGLTVELATGLNYLGDLSNKLSLTPDLIAGRPGMFADIANCYILAYVVGS